MNFTSAGVRKVKYFSSDQEISGLVLKSLIRVRDKYRLKVRRFEEAFYQTIEKNGLLVCEKSSSDQQEAIIFLVFLSCTMLFVFARSLGHSL